MNYEKRQQFIRFLINKYPAHILAQVQSLRAAIAAEVAASAKNSNHSLETQKLMTEEIYNSMMGLDILEPYAKDQQVTEIMVNSYQEIYIERQGKLFRTDLRFDSEKHLLDVITNYFGRANKFLNENKAMADLRLPDGSRVHAVLPPIAVNGPLLSIRRFAGIKPSLEKLWQNGSLSEKAANYLIECVKKRQNIFVCGGTASGKTTMLNALAYFIPPDERIITIEDAAELQLTGSHNLVRLEARETTVAGGKAVTLSDLIRSSLRLRPDRIIVGEVRGTETYDMIQAMQTGHPGSMSTGHGNSAADMLERLSLMLMTGSALPWEASRRMVASALDIMVYLAREHTGQRRVKEICRVSEYRNGEFVLEKLF